MAWLRRKVMREKDTDLGVGGKYAGDVKIH